MRPLFPVAIIGLLAVSMLFSCEKQKGHVAPAINERDSVPTMRTQGVNMLISDSGVIKYRVVAESWDVNQTVSPSRWIFERGLFVEQFDEKFKVQMHIQADTAYYYDQRRLWELRGRVRVLNTDGLRFTSEQLFWDEYRHELYSNVYSKLVTPERSLEGSYFKSNEQMTRYMVSNTKGSFEKGDIEGGSDTLRAEPDTAKAAIRQPIAPQRKGVGLRLRPN